LSQLAAVDEPPEPVEADVPPHDARNSVRPASRKKICDREISANRAVKGDVRIEKPFLLRATPNTL
jgi:hypothetical protein